MGADREETRLPPQETKEIPALVCGWFATNNMQYNSTLLFIFARALILLVFNSLQSVTDCCVSGTQSLFVPLHPFHISLIQATAFQKFVCFTINFFQIRFLALNFLVEVLIWRQNQSKEKKSKVQITGYLAWWKRRLIVNSSETS